MPLAIFGKRPALRGGKRVGDRQPSIGGRDVVVHHRKGLRGPTDLKPTPLQAAERLRAQLVYQVQIDVEEVSPAYCAEQVLFPDLLCRRRPHERLTRAQELALQNAPTAAIAASATCMSCS